MVDTVDVPAAARSRRDLTTRSRRFAALDDDTRDVTVVTARQHRADGSHLHAHERDRRRTLTCALGAITGSATVTYFRSSRQEHSLNDNIAVTFRNDAR